MKVLVLTEHTADDRKSLAAVRSLAAAGVRVHVASDTPRSAPWWSRYVRRRWLCPSPVTCREDFLDWLQETRRREALDAVLPTSDYTVHALVIGRASGATEPGDPVPTTEALRVAHDKFACLELARELGLAIPQTWLVEDPAQPPPELAQAPLPCVVKWRSGAGGEGMHFPTTPAQLAQALADAPCTSDSVFRPDQRLVQERIDGPVHDACFLFDHGKSQAVFTQRRLAMSPLMGGVGIRNVSTHQAEPAELGARLLTALGWHGPAMVEFRQDQRTGEFVLMEINARFWGTLELAVRAGMNFPWWTALLGAGRQLPRIPGYRDGVLMRWDWTYRDALRRQSCPTRDRTESGEFNWRDPLPHLVGRQRKAA